MRFELEIAPLDLDLTLGCGQTFRWRRGPDGSWSGVLSGDNVRLFKRGAVLVADATPGGRYVESRVEEFLRAGDDIARIQKELGTDRMLAAGMARMKGLRIVKLDEWECLISFILATYANIPRISKMVESLASAYGRRISQGVYSFPDRGRLAKASERELARLGLGYRARYVHEACTTIDEEEFGHLRRMGYEDLRDGLIELPGVGDKVADCVCLFGFGRLEAFPIDVWIERALSRLYGRKGSYSKLRRFASDRFGRYAGYAQEYLYHNERMRAQGQACLFLEQ
jgi:N-glycosylase/DNA lyase